MPEIKKRVYTSEDLKKYLDAHTHTEMASTCAIIIAELCKAADEFSNKYMQLRNKYPELFVLTDIGMITAVSAAPFKGRPAPVKVLLGSREAIQLTASAIISGLKEIANDKN